MKICDECETVAHCTKHGCIPKVSAKDAMKLALEALGLYARTLAPTETQKKGMDAITALDKALAEQPAQRKPLTDEQERTAFEEWAVKTICDKSDLQRKELTGYGSQELNYLWRGWSAKSAHGIKENT